jgi:hypothetical protein
MTNPKDLVGKFKALISSVPAPVLFEVGVALLEGALKYGRHNYRVTPVKASIYYDATFRHLTAWWEGEDIDPDSDLSHVTKAIASLVVLRDAMIQNKFVDDRPPKTITSWLPELNKLVAKLHEKYPNPVKPNTEIEIVE